MYAIRDTLNLCDVMELKFDTRYFRNISRKHKMIPMNPFFMVYVSVEILEVRRGLTIAYSIKISQKSMARKSGGF